MGLFKTFRISERFRLKFDVQAFNIFNHPSFDTPNNNVEFNPFFADPADYVGTGNTTCYSQVSGAFGQQAAYTCPPSGHLGVIQHTIGSPRFLQMALHLTF
jgi:hypothetical protein